MVTVALIDGPLNGPDCPAKRHATAMQHSILRNAPTATVTPFSVFHGDLACDVASVCNALDEATASAPDLVLCSFGLARDAPELAARIVKLAQNSIPVIASRPARGALQSWPATYPSVFAVQGDARCQPDQWSLLGPKLWFGACAVFDMRSKMAGASVAAAHFSGIVAQHLERKILDALPLETTLSQTAHWVGREVKTAMS